MEMLRVRDEKRRVRQVEAIRRQKEVEDEEAAGAVRKGGEEGGPRVETMEDQGDVFSPPKVAPKPRTPTTTALFEESSSTSSSNPVASDRPVSQHRFPTLTSERNLSAKINAVR